VIAHPDGLTTLRPKGDGMAYAIVTDFGHRQVMECLRRPDLTLQQWVDEEAAVSRLVAGLEQTRSECYAVLAVPAPDFVGAVERDPAMAEYAVTLSGRARQAAAALRSLAERVEAAAQRADAALCVRAVRAERAGA
jgi:hypothetical protein